MRFAAAPPSRRQGSTTGIRIRTRSQTDEEKLIFGSRTGHGAVKFRSVSFARNCPTYFTIISMWPLRRELVKIITN
jgi:hypothetical protein